jgi:flagella basal body P-ring formation protein FlgA
MWVKTLTVGFAVLSGACHAQAVDGLQTLASVRSAAERAVRGVLDPKATGVSVDAGALDSRLRLAACAAPLDTHAQPPRGNQSRVLARISCTQGSPWTVHVPVDIRRTHGVLVLRRAVARGETIGAADVDTQTRDLPGMASPYVMKVEELSGRLTKRALSAGTLLSADALTAALLIHRGQEVTLTASANGFEVRAPGRALADAAAQQRVRVQNLLSLRVVEGVADSAGVVRVTH